MKNIAPRAMHRPVAAPGRQGGMMLIEALIGILIFSIGILALIAMQAVAIQNNIEARYRTEASFLANQIVAQMWADCGAASNCPGLSAYDTDSGSSTKMTAWRDQVAATLPGITAGGANSPVIDVNGVAVTVRVFWKLPDSNASVRNFTVVAQISGQ